jgi:hypothetical protein
LYGREHQPPAASSQTGKAPPLDLVYLLAYQPACSGMLRLEALTLLNVVVESEMILILQSCNGWSLILPGSLKIA